MTQSQVHRKSSPGQANRPEATLRRITAALLDFLRTGLGAGMLLPDPADPHLHTIRVVARDLWGARSMPGL
jgi:hypothetical protein